MGLLNQIPPDKIHLVDEIRDKWITLGLSNQPLDPEKVVPAIHWLYRINKRPAPLVVCVDGPQAGLDVLPMMFALARSIDVESTGPDEHIPVGMSNVRMGIGFEVWEQIKEQVASSVWGDLLYSLRDRILHQIKTFVWDSVRNEIHNAEPVRLSKNTFADEICDQVGNKVAIPLAEEIFYSVWDQFLYQVWELSKQPMPFMREEISQDRILKRAKLGRVGLGFDVGWTAFYDLWRALGIVAHEEFDRWVNFLETGIWSGYFYRQFAVVFPGPTEVHLEPGPGVRETGVRRLHNLTGPALRFADGFSIYRVLGVSVDGDLIDNPERITVDRIFQERNAEVRKGLIQVMGVERFLEQTDARLLDSDTDRAGMPRRLFGLYAGQGQQWCVIEVECPSKRDKHYLWVPPDMTRCSQAVAWTFGFEAPEDYRPMVET